MNKKLKVFSIGLIACFIFVYGIFSFANWQYNPGKWTESARAGMAICLFFSGMVAGFITFVINED